MKNLPLPSFPKIAIVSILSLASVTLIAQQRPAGGAGGPRPGGTPRDEAPFSGMIAANDANKDGALSKSEISKLRNFSESLFDVIDTNGDGIISLAEAKGADKVDTQKGPPKRIDFEGKQWIADHAIGAEIVDYKGKKAFHIVGREQCLVYLPIDDFQDGTIEVDIAGDIFSGIGFRVRDKGTRAEKLYFRPQNANTDRHQNTVQYSVLGRRDGHWSQLRRNFPGKYESGAGIAKGEWFRARLEIKGEALKVYANGTLLLTVDPMLDGVTKGSVGIWGWDSYFANFKYTPAK